ncbi:CZB domain-containing protein [Oceanobacter mangrovi]|uniref:CZB domain-containing protein n=1 Tax=Oceanobacter mangrovi TaxID=2862510 RepID=UPI003CCE9073
MATDVMQVGQVSEQASKVIQSSADHGFLNSVKLDHLLWMHAVYTRIQEPGQDSRPPGNESECRLGHWMTDGEGYQRFRQFTAFGRLKEPHHGVHQDGIAALEAFKRGDHKQMTQKLFAMERHSESVIRLLNELAYEQKQRHNSSKSDSNSKPRR